MKTFHLSYDIADESGIDISQIVRVLCGDLQSIITKHRVKSTFIFQSDHILDDIASAIDEHFPRGFYYELTEVCEHCRGRQNPTIENDYIGTCRAYHLL